MAIRNTNPGTPRFNVHDNQRTTIHEIRQLKNEITKLTSSGSSIGSASLAEQLVQTSVLNSMNGKLTTILNSVSRGKLATLKETANDLQEVYAYLDPTDAVNRRISTITYSSVTLALTVTETFSYAGNPGDYYVISSTLS